VAVTYRPADQRSLVKEDFHAGACGEPAAAMPGATPPPSAGVSDLIRLLGIHLPGRKAKEARGDDLISLLPPWAPSA
jgi:hypothetical protein